MWPRDERLALEHMLENAERALEAASTRRREDLDAPPQTKRKFLDEWVRAVNEHGGFGRWSWAVSRHPSDVAGLLAKA